MNYRQPFEGSYPITQGYGGTDTSAYHTGIDYGCPLGTPILASEDGTVYFAGWDNSGYGNCVILQHPDGKATLYAHLRDLPLVKTGQQVKRSQLIGFSGSTGNSTGPHLHFEARTQAGNYKTHFDPMELPLHSSIDPAVPPAITPAPPINTPALKGASEFFAGELLKVQNTLGVKAYYNTTFTDYCTYPKGTPFYYTGETVVRKDNGLTYMRVVPATFTVLVAVNDGDVQILDEA